MCPDRSEAEWYGTVLAVRDHEVLVRYVDQPVKDEGSWWLASHYERVA
jgi:hypothetical protein